MRRWRFTRWGASLPPDDEIRRYLVRERGFNDNTVKDFITEYKATLSFAKVGAGDKIPEGTGAEDGAPGTGPKVGDLVQWTSMGMDMFDEPRPVRGFADDGEFAFVPGTDTGIPVDELTVVGRAMAEIDKVDKKPPPANPFKGSPAAPTKQREVADDAEWGVPPLRFPLPRGNVIEIRLKSKVNAAEFKKIKKIFDLSAFAFLEDEDAEEMMDDDKDKDDKDE